jgi:hypothetical protein
MALYEDRKFFSTSTCYMHGLRLINTILYLNRDNLLSIGVIYLYLTNYIEYLIFKLLQTCLSLSNFSFLLG